VKRALKATKWLRELRAMFPLGARRDSRSAGSINQHKHLRNMPPQSQPAESGLNGSNPVAPVACWVSRAPDCVIGILAIQKHISRMGRKIELMYKPGVALKH